MNFPFLFLLKCFDFFLCNFAYFTIFASVFLIDAFMSMLMFNSTSSSLFVLLWVN